MQGTSEEPLKELSAREIFNRILKGEVIKIPNDPVLARQLKNHLNVIMSRERKLFNSLDLDFPSAIIKVSFQETYHISNLERYYEISLTAPKKRRKYPLFAVENKTDGPASNS